jgi:hypothetical protein
MSEKLPNKDCDATMQISPFESFMPETQPVTVACKIEVKLNC